MKARWGDRLPTLYLPAHFRGSDLGFLSHVLIRAYIFPPHDVLRSPSGSDCIHVLQAGYNARSTEVS